MRWIGEVRFVVVDGMREGSNHGVRREGWVAFAVDFEEAITGLVVELCGEADRKQTQGLFDYASCVLEFCEPVRLFIQEVDCILECGT